MFRLCPCWGRQHNLFCCVQPGWHGCQCRLHLLLEGQGCVQTQLKTHEVDMLRRVHVQIKKIFFVCLLFWGCFYLDILLLQSFFFFNNFWISLIWELWKDLNKRRMDTTQWVSNCICHWNVRVVSTDTNENIRHRITHHEWVMTWTCFNTMKFTVEWIP